MKYFLLTCFFLFSAFTVLEVEVACETIVSETAIMDDVIEEVYYSLEGKRPNKDVFISCIKGYHQLSDQLSDENDKQIITVVDYRMSSNEKRLWVIDLNEKKVLFHTLVAHGKNTGNEYAKSFSNVSGSHQSSLGFYITGETYTGKHGTSLYLDGVEEGINDNAMDRYIVMHGAEYVSKEFIKENGRLGRSFGCPSVPVDISFDIIEAIKEGTCLFLFYPENKYLSSSKLMEKIS